MSTLSVIRGNVRRNLGEITPQFYTNAELNQFIGEAYRYYTIKMIEEGEGYFETTVNLALTANNPLIDLTALSPTFFSISELRRNTSTGTYPLSRDEERFSPTSNFVVASGDGYRPKYKLRGMNIVLNPIPQSTESASSTTGLKLDYYYLPTLPAYDSVDGFTFDSNFSTIYEPIIELHATIAALESKDGMGGVSDVQSFRNRLTKFEEAFYDSLERSEAPDQVQYFGLDYQNIF